MADAKVFCSILPYVAKVNPKLHSVIMQTCTDRSINNGKNKTGTTFIMPDHKELLDRIYKLAASSNADDVQQAADIINAHVIRIPLRSATDWNTRKDNIPNSIFPSQRVEIDKATGDEVHFKGGAVAKLDKDFVQMMSKEEQANPRRALTVYRLTKGELSVTKDKPAMPIKAKTGGKTGGYALVGTIADQTDRFKIGITVENDFMLHKLQRMADPNVKHCDIYADYTYGLVHYMCNESRYHEDLATKVIPLLSGSCIDFYILVEPHRRETNMLLDDGLVSSWWASPSRKFHGNFSELKAKLMELVSGRTEACYKDPVMLQSCVDDLRQEIPADKRIAEVIASMYEQFVSSNSIGECTSVLPEALISYYKSNPGLKLLQDECRYVCHLAFERLEKRAFNRADYESILNTIGDYLVEKGRNKLINPMYFKIWIQPTDQINEAEIFINSLAFIYVNPMGVELDVAVITHRPTDPSESVFDPFASKLETHQRLYVDSAAPEGLVSALKALGIANVDSLLKSHGL